MPRTRRESDAEASSIELDQPGAQIDLELGLRRREETELPLEEVMRELKKEAKKKAEEATRKREEAGRVLEEIGREVEELERKYEEAKKKKTEKKKREREEAKREAEKAARQLIQEERQLQERGIRLWTPTCLQLEFTASYGTVEYFALLVKNHCQNYFSTSLNLDESEPQFKAVTRARFLEALSQDYMVWEVLNESNEILKKSTTDQEQMLRIRRLFKQGPEIDRLLNTKSIEPSRSSSPDEVGRIFQAEINSIAPAIGENVPEGDRQRDTETSMKREGRKRYLRRELNRWQRVVTALLASAGFLVPMLVMVINPSLIKSIVTSSVFIVVFAIFVAWFHYETM